MKNIYTVKSFTALIMILTIVFTGVISGCNSKNEPNNETTDNGAINNTSDISDENISTVIKPDIPESADYGGAKFTILTRTINSADWADWDHRDIYAESETGELINDAVFRRNKKIEEAYNVVIIEYRTEKYLDDIKKAVKANEPAYDVVMPRLVDCTSLAQDGSFVDLHTIPNIDLSKPWWNQGAVRDLSIGNKVYFTQGDLSIMSNDATSAIIFNKKILAQESLEDPYQLVREGTWTLDKLSEMVKGTSKDLDGDDKMNIHNDKFGLIAQSDSTLSFFLGTGEHFVGKDENDLPVITFGSDRSYQTLDKIYNLMTDKENVIDLHRFEGQFPIYEEQAKMFQDDRALFSWIRMRVVEKLRSMETDFGIVPIPKLESTQSQYWNQVNSHTSTVICVPQSTPDLERTGLILEALSAESRYTLQPAYFDINLYGKFTRDEESREMLDLIFNSTIYDIGEVYNFGGFAQTIGSYPTRDNSSFSSFFEKSSEKMAKEIQKTVEKYEKFE